MVKNRPASRGDTDSISGLGRSPGVGNGPPLHNLTWEIARTEEHGGHEVDVVLPLCLIPAAKHRVGSSQDGAAGVEGGGDASLRGEYGGSRGEKRELGLTAFSGPGHTLR